MVKSKICGITDEAGAREAARDGADYLGLVFAPSRRQVLPSRAWDIVQAVRAPGPRPKLVGVFAGTPAGDVNRIVEYCGLDMAQLSGGEDWDFCRRIKFPIIKAIHISPATAAKDVLAEIEDGYRRFESGRLTFLLDTAFGGKSGGTGHTFNWNVAREVARNYPVIVAGGLDPDNVGRLVRYAYPWGVDVSSGVETGGAKDPAKIQAFIKAVRSSES